MSQLWGMYKYLAVSDFAKLLAKFHILPSFASRERCMPVWYKAPLVVNEGAHIRGEVTIDLYGLSAE
jgi:hypothetical protein